MSVSPLSKESNEIARMRVEKEETCLAEISRHSRLGRKEREMKEKGRIKTCLNLRSLDRKRNGEACFDQVIENIRKGGRCQKIKKRIEIRVHLSLSLPHTHFLSIASSLCFPVIKQRVLVHDVMHKTQHQLQFVASIFVPM